MKEFMSAKGGSASGGKKTIFFVFFVFFAAFAIQTVQAGTVTGTVTTPDGGDLPVVTVKAYTGEDPITEVMAEATVDGSGNYSITLDEGTYYPFAMPDPDSDYSFNAMPDAISGGVTTTLDLELTETQVRGVLYLPDGETGAEGWIAEAHTGDGTTYRAMITDSEGKFNIGGLTTGVPLGLEFRTGPEITGAGYDQPAGYNLGTLTEDQEITELTFELVSAPKTLNFTVLYPEGTGVENATVSIYPVRGRLRHATSCWTDNSGTCSADISGGQWIIDVNPDYGQDNTDIDWAYFEPATQVEFAEDESVESEDFTFTVVETDAWVSGILLNHDGSIPLTSDIHVLNSDGNGIWGKINNDTGAFNFPVVAGVLIVRAFPLNEQSDDAFPVNRIVVTPGETYDLGTIYGLNPTATISGYLLTPNGDPIPGKDVTAWDFDNEYHTWDATDTSGAFSLSVYPGTWVISVESDDEYEALTDLPVEITADYEVSSDHVLQMKRRGKTISGSLLDKDGDSVDASDFIPYAIDANGQTYTGDLGSGNNYSLTVPANNTYEVYLFFDPDSEYLIEDKLTVTVEEEDVADQDFTVLHDTATVSGQIQDANGNAVGLQTRIVATNHYGVRTTEADEYTGEYEIELPKGEWQVTCEILEATDDYFAQTGETEKITLTAGEEEILNFTLVETPYSVSGQVEDADGTALPYTEVYLSNDETKQAGEDLIQLFATADENGQFSFRVPVGTYELGAGAHLESENVVPAVQEVTVSNDVTDQTLVFEEADVTLQGEVNKDTGYVRAYATNGHFYLAEIEDGEYSLNVATGDVLTVEAFSLSGEKFYRNIQQEITVDEDEELDLTLYEDPSVEVPSTEIVSFQADEPQILNVAEKVTLEIPVHALGDVETGEVTLVATPSLEINSHDYDAPINFSYEFVAKESDGTLLTEFNRPITVNMGWEQRELKSLGVKEKNLKPRFAEETSGLLENTGAVVLDKQENEAVFVTDHFSKFTLATPYTGKYKVLKTTGVHALKKKTNQVTLKWSNVFAAKKYQIKYRKVGAKKWQLVKTKKQRKIIKGLTSGTKYQCKVRAIRGKQEGKWSRILKVKTK